MKQVLLLFILCVYTSTSFAQDKIALLVAIGQYPPASRVRPIASLNDLKYIKSALNKHGFTDKNIQTLINAKATKQGILASLTAMARKAKKNDIIVLSFSCHGQQIRDQRTIALGKDEDDGYDEALVPYDAKGAYSPTGYRGEKHLRDDDLFPILQEMRRKIGQGGSLLVLIDACHSGTGTRADDFPASRGEPVPFPDPENPFNPADLSDLDKKEAFLDVKADSLSNMVVISGSGPHQINKQVFVNNEEVGSLSYGFYKAMSEMAAGNDYSVLYEKIKSSIQAVIPDQLPMIEGNTSQVIFSGRYLPVQDRMVIRVGTKEATSTVSDSIFTLNRGMMDQLAVGVTGTIYPLGKATPVGTAIIRKTSPFSSVGVASVLLKKAETYELRVAEANYGNLSALLQFDRQDKWPAGAEKQVRKLLSPYGYISFSEQPGDFQLRQSATTAGRQLDLMDRNNQLIWSAPLTTADTVASADQLQLIRGIRNALQVKYLRTMPDGGELAQWVSAEILAGEDKKPGSHVLAEGDRYSLKLVNKSEHKLFFTVLDIYPDNKVEVLYPYKGKEPADYSIEKKSFVERKLSVSKGSPAGVEFLKIIVSKEPLDLRGVFEQKVQRENMQSFQVMLDDLFSRQDGKEPVRADVSAIKMEEIGIITVNFTIRK
jgi:metacaspase-1